MQFNIEHDWQENMSTPRAKVGERTKTHLLIFLCAIWLGFGLIGHDPWYPFESQAISTVQSLLEHTLLSSQLLISNTWLAPLSASQTVLETPPLYYWCAAILAKLLNPILDVHNAARLSTGIWMLLTLLMIGMSGRELWGKGVGRQSSFIFVANLGLIVSAHTIAPEVATLAGMSTSFYALILAHRKPKRASLLLGAGLLISFFAGGLLPFITVLISIALLHLFANWRINSVSYSLLIGIIAALPLITLWCWLCYQRLPDLFTTWWQFPFSHANQQKHFYLLRTLAWSAWPALPIAIWGLWRFRKELLRQPAFQLCSIFFMASFVGTNFFAERHETTILPMLIPLTALAAGSIETLKRGAAGALNWFGLILFSLLMFIVWLGWWSIVSGSPHRLYARLSYLSGLNSLQINLIYLIMATAATLIWLSTALRTNRSNRAIATNWAVGMSCTWVLFMTLWLPMVEAARSYQIAFESLKRAMPKQYACVSSRNLSKTQLDLLHYHAKLRVYPLETTQVINCDLMLIETTSDGTLYKKLGLDWTLIWQGKQGRTGRDMFALYYKVLQ